MADGHNLVYSNHGRKVQQHAAFLHHVHVPALFDKKHSYPMTDIDEPQSTTYNDDDDDSVCDDDRNNIGIHCNFT